MSLAIEVKNLTCSYQGNVALNDINFSINEGNLVGIIGPNGAGKSTLLKAMLNLIKKDTGEIRILGRSIREMKTKVAYVPQRSDIDWDFPITVLDTVLLGTYPNLGLFKRPKKEDKLWALACLKQVGIESYCNRQIGELSGGQQQRVFLARALAQKAEMYFLDEPFVGVDITSEETIISVLKQLRNDGKTVVVVHHDLSKAADYFDELILLNKELIEYGTVAEVFEPEVISRAYNQPFNPKSNAEVFI
jgi:iron/zinc/copper transport system ATP-binding protein